jgi:hypothetical protein
MFCHPDAPLRARIKDVLGNGAGDKRLEMIRPRSPARNSLRTEKSSDKVM